MHLLTLMELLQTAKDQGGKKKSPAEKLKAQLCVSTSICDSAVPRENMGTVKFPQANDSIQKLI